jgi:hypothetical protein
VTSRQRTVCGVVLCLISLSLQSCVSFLSAGPLGYETTALPVAAPADGKGAEVSFVDVQASAPGSTVLLTDYSMNLFVGAGAGWSTPAWNGFFFNVPIALSGFAGAAVLRSGLTDQYPNGVSKPYYGASLQLQPSLNFIAPEGLFRLGLGTVAWANAEAGPYASFRSTVHGDGSYVFVNDSPTPWSGGWGYWVEGEWGVQPRVGVRFTLEGAAPDLTSFSVSGLLPEGTSLSDLGEKFEIWTEQDHNRFMFGYELLAPLNNSFFFGYMRTF